MESGLQSKPYTLVNLEMFHYFLVIKNSRNRISNTSPITFAEANTAFFEDFKSFWMWETEDESASWVS